MLEVLDLKTAKDVKIGIWNPNKAEFSQSDACQDRFILSESMISPDNLPQMLYYGCFLTEEEAECLSSLSSSPGVTETTRYNSLTRLENSLEILNPNHMGSEFSHFRDILIDIHSIVAGIGKDGSEGTHSYNILLDEKECTLEVCYRGLDNLGDEGHWVSIMSQIMLPYNLCNTLPSQITLSATGPYSHSISLCSPLEGGLHIDYSINGEQVEHFMPSSNQSGSSCPYLSYLENARSIKLRSKSVTALGEEALSSPVGDLSSIPLGQTPAQTPEH